MNQPLIFRLFPELAEKIPWVSLGKFPTPVQHLRHLEKAVGLSSLWIKRDDVSGEVYGGNKVRTLEFSLADALRKRSEVILAYSALGSNWPLACAIYAKMYDIPTDVFFLPYPMDGIKEKNLHHTRQIARRTCSARSFLTFPFLLGAGFLKAKRGRRVYLMPPGGVSPITTLGYINAVLELREQCDRGEMPIPDCIFCPLGSGGTAAGIAIGLHLVGWPTRVIAVRVVDFIVANKIVLNRLIKKTINVMKTKGADLRHSGDWGRNIHIEHRFFGRGYGIATELGDQARELVKTHENQLLDATYTSKTFAAMLDLTKRDALCGKTLLFWQTLNSVPLESLHEKIKKMITT